MQALYHIERQAELFARQIIPVREGYPLLPGLEEGFRADFERLCTVVKQIYLDMAARPGEYGLPLVPLEETKANTVRDSYRAVHRLMDTLEALCQSGKIEHHDLAVDTKAFLSKARKIPKYTKMLWGLTQHGFTIDGFDGASVKRGTDLLRVSFPAQPDMLSALCIYCANWSVLNHDRAKIRIRPKEFHHHYYRMDYKITADLDKLPIEVWLADEARYNLLSEGQTQVYLAFYKASLRYPKLRFDGEYHLGSKRVARVLEGDRHRIQLKLNHMDRYPEAIAGLPPRLRATFEKNSCAHCVLKYGTDDRCKYRLNWMCREEPHEGCAFYCFSFPDPQPQDVEPLLGLLEHEYGIRPA